MNFFEENIKDSLLQETRVLTMPDDSLRLVMAFKLCWDAYDFIMDYGNYEQDALVRMALVMTEASGRSFEAEFFNLVAAAQRLWSERLNTDWP